MRCRHTFFERGTSGTENAKALQDADVKIIANSGNARDGIGSVAELVSSKGGQQTAAFVEGLTQSPLGKALLDRAGVTAEDEPKTNGSANGSGKSQFMASKKTSKRQASKSKSKDAK